MSVFCPYCPVNFEGSTALADHMVDEHTALAKAIFVQYFESLRGKGSSPEAEIARGVQNRALEDAKNKFDVLKKRAEPRSV